MLRSSTWIIAFYLSSFSSQQVGPPADMVVAGDALLQELRRLNRQKSSCEVHKLV